MVPHAGSAEPQGHPSKKAGRWVLGGSSAPCGFTREGASERSLTAMRWLSARNGRSRDGQTRSVDHTRNEGRILSFENRVFRVRIAISQPQEE